MPSSSLFPAPDAAVLPLPPRLLPRSPSPASLLPRPFHRRHTLVAYGRPSRDPLRVTLRLLLRCHHCGETRQDVARHPPIIPMGQGVLGALLVSGSCDLELISLLSPTSSGPPPPPPLPPSGPPGSTSPLAPQRRSLPPVAKKVHSHVDIYNFSDNTWEEGFDMPKEMAHSHLGMVTDGRFIYVVTGHYGPQCRGPTARNFVLDTETKEWCDLPSLPVPRYAPATQLWRGRLHVMGGSKEDRLIGMNLDLNIGASQ